MTFGEKLKSARKSAEMTQEQLANRLSVSRQAVTKWEADKGLPDIGNLRLLSAALNISLDDLLDESSRLDISVIREPVYLSDYAGLHTTAVRCWLKKDRLRDEAIKARFPDAEIHTLIHKQLLTKTEKRVQTFFWLTTPFANAVELLQSFQNADRLFYLVWDMGRQYFVMVTDECMEIRQLAERIVERKFEMNGFRFSVSPYLL